MSYYEHDSGKNLIDSLLTEQQSLTAVERFSQFHNQDHPPNQEPYYRNLIPTGQPQKGEQYSFEVNLDACTGCKACVTACHSLNGLDEKESWRDVGVLFGGTHIKPRQQTVTTACHHCADPACLNGCPVLAYEKDEETGIVRHLDDQCIGCQYCILKCPYDVPKYNPRLGIVRKCDMCIGRLKEGEAPACVQACPTQAIAIRIVKINDLSGTNGNNPRMLPGAFQSDYTQPSTTFRTKQKLPENVVAADTEDLTPEHAHTPLVWMLTLTQVSIGMMSAAWIFNRQPGSHTLSIVGLMIGLIGMTSSVFHLGNPKGAWRAFLGLRKSWLSREIVVLGMWFPLTITHTGAISALDYWPHLLPIWTPTLTGLGSSFLGLIGVYCSVMVYVDTRRDFWAFRRSAARFFGTTLISGAVAATILGVPFAPHLLITLLLGKLTSEAMSLLPARQATNIYARKSARLQLYPLRRTLLLRGGFALIAAIMTLSISAMPSPVLGSILLVAAMILGELFERNLYFRAVAAPRMPGLIASQSTGAKPTQSNSILTHEKVA